MRLSVLALTLALLIQYISGHIVDSDGNCIADCHTDDDELDLGGVNYAIVDLENVDRYQCGIVNTTYTTSDRVVLCLFFDQMEPEPQKVVFSPRVDAFEVMQIKGLYDQFASRYNKDTPDEGVRMSMTAMVSGVKSAPTVFKQNNEVASVVELQITMKDGNITSVDWIHGCGIGCGGWTCANAYVVDVDGYGLAAESNCYVSGCSVPGEPTCDTQVFVTWRGTDVAGEHCESVNYSIHGFGRFGAGKYMDSARKLPD